MTSSRLKPAFFVGLFLSVLVATLQGVQGEEQLDPAPTVPEDLCRPYIEKALKDLGTGSLEQTSAEVGTEEDGDSREEGEQPSQEKDEEITDSEQHEHERSGEQEAEDETEADDGSHEETKTEEVAGDSQEQADSSEVPTEHDDDNVEDAAESAEIQDEQTEESVEKEAQSEEIGDATKEDEDEVSVEKAESEHDSGEGEAEAGESEEDTQQADDEEAAAENAEGESDEMQTADDGKSDEDKDETAENDVSKDVENEKTSEEKADSKQEADSREISDDIEAASAEVSAEIKSSKDDGNIEEGESAEVPEVSPEDDETDSKPEIDGESKEDETTESAEEHEATMSAESQQEDSPEKEGEEESEKEGEEESAKDEEESGEVKSRTVREIDDEADIEPETEGGSEVETETEKEPSQEDTVSPDAEEHGDETEDSKEAQSEEEEEPTPEEDLIQEIEIPENLRPRDHINQLLKLDEENEEKERAIEKVADIILRDLKKVYDNAIKPLETLYKYRDLSNRHFGDPEIFSKPLVLFMGPWSGGKSSIINYLLNIEYEHTSLRTGAEPSPAYFNILMHGEEEEILDGTQLAADWTFSGLQKFGQGLLDRLRGLRLNNKLLEKVNIVEIPGILEIRKQVQRMFPFNDACQWFIDRADIIFLVYDPSKLDVGPETEAILDQLKGREYQTRIILNKADQVKPEELMRVQGALIWNISPLMSSAEPPIMYSTSLWSMPYEAGAPTRLLYAQERAFLRDLRSAVDKRVEHKIASARRFAVRVRNHAKMVDCYLTTYYNHKTFFGNKKDISDKIIENPQDYHIYEGLSTLTNISRYDLPDPDVYRDFFRLNPLYDFPLLSSTCTYFRGCPINRLDVAIAYDLPELVGKYKKSVEAVIHESETNS